MSRQEARQEIIQAPTRQVAQLEPAMAKVARAIDSTAQSYALAVQGAQGQVERALLMGSAIVALREALNERVMAQIMPLIGTPNGIGSDRPQHPGGKREPYTAAEVREALITSLMYGFYPVNNEWGIISGRFFGQKNGWKRKLEEVPGISNISVAAGKPHVVEQSVVMVRVALAWKIAGKADCLRDGEGKPGRPFTLHSYGNEKPDLFIGKAEARAYRAAYLQATGSTYVPDEAEVEALPDGGQASAQLGQSKAQQLEDRLRNQQRTAQQATQQPAQHPDFEAGARMAEEES